MKTNVCYQGDCLDVLKTLEENSVDSIVTDPPYELGFMGKSWDNSGIAYSVPMWKECLRVLKPGGHLLSFSGTRTYHRMAVAIEDAGFEVRDMIEWVYGSGFPKSLNIGKAVDKLRGNEREVVGSDRSGSSSRAYQSEEQTTAGEYKIDKGTSEWEGWGTALKPAHEPICLARKPLSEKTVAENCLKWGTGGINIDESRVDVADSEKESFAKEWDREQSDKQSDRATYLAPKEANKNLNEFRPTGRFPANIITDGSEEVRECFPETKSSKGSFKAGDYEERETSTNFTRGDFKGRGDSGSASRFFKSILYYPKASKADRNKGCDNLEEKETNRYGNFNGTEEHAPKKDIKNTNFHPTCKPTSLMKYLITMITPKGGIVLDPFTGSGSTLVAAKENGFQYVGIELTEEYLPIIQARTGCEIVHNDIQKQETPIKYVEEEKPIVIQKPKNDIDKCPCGGKIVKLKSGVRTCENCLMDY